MDQDADSDVGDCSPVVRDLLATRPSYIASALENMMALNMCKVVYPDGTSFSVSCENSIITIPIRSPLRGENFAVVYIDDKAFTEYRPEQKQMIESLWIKTKPRKRADRQMPKAYGPPRKKRW